MKNLCGMKAVWLGALLVCVGCVDGGEAEVAPDAALVAQPAGAPGAGKADGKDGADRGCQVVLRDVARRSDGRGGFETAGGAWVWTGQVDVALGALDGGAVPGVVFRSNTDFRPQWWQKGMVSVEGARAGFQRFEFRIDEHTPSPGMSGTSLDRSRIDLIPFLKLSDGGRIFDHNRLPGEFDNYALDKGNGWRIFTDAGLCSEIDTPFVPETEGPVLTFGVDWSVEQDAPLVAGERFSIVYDLGRLTKCRGTHNGHPAWDVRALVAFEPSGEVEEVSVRRFHSRLGTSINSAYSVPAIFDIPEGTEGLSIWFFNTSVSSGGLCEAYDSNFGENYPFIVKGE